MKATLLILAFLSLSVLGSCSHCLADANSEVEHGNVAFDVSPRGKQVVFSAADGDLYLLRLKSLRVSQLTRTKAVESTPAFSPDGRFIVYAADDGQASHVFIRSLDGKVARQLTSNKATSDAMPSFSHDGSHIVFARAYRHRPYSFGGWTWDNYDICTMKSDGAQQHRLTRQSYYGASSPHFVGKGNIVYPAVVGYPKVETQLFVVNAQGKPPRVLTPDTRRKTEDTGSGTLGSNPNVSRDDQQLVFISDRAQPFAYDLYHMKVGTTKPVALRITGISTYNENPVWMPDGRSVLFLAGTESNSHARPIFSLWSVGANGKNLRRIVDSGLFTAPLKWNPGAKRA